MNIVLATTNKKKIEEIKDIFEDAGIPLDNVFTLKDFPEYPDVVEDGETFEENAVKKAKTIAERTCITAIADDSGLEVDALGGAPGVFSARYAGEPSDDKKNVEKLLNEMANIPDEKRKARFVCCIAIASPEGEINTFLGYVEGIIGREPKGENGFGYDPVFYPEGHNRTFAEMSGDEKNAMSHRGRAIRQLQGYLKKK
ncbi:MAG: XTP/dITP diphosphatase [Nitrospirae bacterium]|nr:XTP/dITP diphosphatase [Nitrospirota bacterium]